MIIGIDPGITGAIVALYDDGEIAAVFDMPVVKKPNGRREVDAANLAQKIEAMAALAPELVTAVVEQVGAMPRQGVASVFSFGDSFGVIRGVLGALGIPVRRVTPNKWKKAAGLVGQDKDRARTLAIEKWPKQAARFERKKDVGRADAALIAFFGG